MTESRTSRVVVPRSIAVIVAICVVIEVLLSAADAGLISGRSLRIQAIAVAGFRIEVLGPVQPVYPGHPAVMFLSYSFLHAGLIHLGVNMVTLLGLGAAVVQRAGQRYFLWLYVFSALGGSICYLVIGPAGVPMVGASGALFGLVGALAGWDVAAARIARKSIAPALRFILLLVVLNVVLWWIADGQLAWQTHLGGGVIGFAIGLAFPDRSSSSA